MEQLKKRVGDSAAVYKVDIDKNQQLAAEYGVRSVPTLLLFKNGALIWRKSGVMSAEELEKIINQNKQNYNLM